MAGRELMRRMTTPADTLIYKANANSIPLNNSVGEKNKI